MNNLDMLNFVRILLEIIIEKQFDSSQTSILFYTYLRIIYDILSIYNYDFKSLDKNIEKLKYTWYKILLFNETFYKMTIIYMNVELLKLLNKDINSIAINNFLINIYEKSIEKNKNYISFIDSNNKIIDEIQKNLKNIYDNSNISSLLSNPKIGLDIFNNNDNILKSLFNNDILNNLTNSLLNEYKKINKMNELVEILNLCQNLCAEQKMISSFWINVINRVGIIGFWNWILYLNLNSNSKISIIDQIDLFYNLNLFLFNGVLYLNFIKNTINSVSPYQILKDNILEFNNNSLWFVEQNINIKYCDQNDYPSEVNLLSTIASKYIKTAIGINIKNIKFTKEDLELIYDHSMLYTMNNINLCNFPILTPDNNLSHINKEHLFVNLCELDNINDSISKTYVYLIQVYLTSNSISKEVANLMFEYLDNYVKNRV